MTYLNGGPDKLFDNTIYGKGYLKPAASNSQVHSNIDTHTIVVLANPHSGVGKRRGSFLKRSSGAVGRTPSLTKRTQSQHNLLDTDDSGDYDSLEICGPAVTMETDNNSQPAVKIYPTKPR